MCLNSQPFHLHFKHTGKTDAEPSPGAESQWALQGQGGKNVQINEQKFSLYRFSPSLLMKG